MVNLFLAFYQRQPEARHEDSIIVNLWNLLRTERPTFEACFWHFFSFSILRINEMG